MTSFVHPSFPSEHPGVARVESAIAAVQDARQGFDSTKGLAAVMLAAVVSALVLAADQLTEVWTDGHLFAMWVVMWAVGLAAVALLAGTARRLATSLIQAADAWSARMAQARADERFLISAQHNPRVMADLTAAMARQTDAALAVSATGAAAEVAEAAQDEYTLRGVRLRLY